MYDLLHIDNLILALQSVIRRDPNYYGDHEEYDTKFGQIIPEKMI
jgi:hypothetical protein